MLLGHEVPCPLTTPPPTPVPQDLRRSCPVLCFIVTLTHGATPGQKVLRVTSIVVTSHKPTLNQVLQPVG